MLILLQFVIIFSFILRRKNGHLCYFVRRVNLASVLVTNWDYDWMFYSAWCEYWNAMWQKVRLNIKEKDWRWKTGKQRQKPISKSSTMTIQTMPSLSPMTECCIDTPRFSPTTTTIRRLLPRINPIYFTCYWLYNRLYVVWSGGNYGNIIPGMSN